jgi:hypothetical protein
MSKQSNIKVTCLSLNCPERISVCCGAKPRAVSSDEGTGYFACAGCGKEYIGGECDAMGEPETPQVYVELAYMYGVLEASGMPSHQVRRHVEKQGQLLEAVLEISPKEIVICAAIKTKDGTIIRGHRHADAIHTAMRMRYKATDLSFADQGFVTSRNRYVTREEGRRIQDAAGVKSASPEGYMPGTLFSEDLY